MSKPAIGNSQRSWARGRLLVAGLCAVLGFLVVPALVAAGLALSVIGGAARRGRWDRVVVGSILLAAALGTGLLGIRLYQRITYRMALSWHAAALAAAINVHYNVEKGLPETIEELMSSGRYGDDPYRLPGSQAGPRPCYLPIKNWDGESKVIVAVTARSQKYPEMERFYVVLGDTSAHAASRDGLRALLAEDDRTRKRLVEQRRWADIPWDEIPKQ